MSQNSLYKECNAFPPRWMLPVACFAKPLDTGLKAKFPEIKGTLYERIEEAAKQHKLTPDMVEWAHEIRLEGNNAVHEDKPFSKDEAEHLFAFTHLVFLYLFTLPGRLEEAQGAAAKAANSE